MTDYITVEQLADYLSIDDSNDDVGLAAAVAGAQQAIDAWCGRGFSGDTVASTRTYIPCGSWVADVDDFYETASLVVKTDTGDNGTYDQTWSLTTDFILEPSNPSDVGGIVGWPYSRICATGNRYFPHSPIGSGRRHRLQVTAKWGWSAVPDAVVLATYIKAARLFRRRNAPEGGAGFETSQFNVPVIRVATREDPDVTALLAPFRDLTVFA